MQANNFRTQQFFFENTRVKNQAYVKVICMYLSLTVEMNHVATRVVTDRQTETDRQTDRQTHTHTPPTVTLTVHAHRGLTMYM